MTSYNDGSAAGTRGEGGSGGGAAAGTSSAAAVGAPSGSSSSVHSHSYSLSHHAPHLSLSGGTVTPGTVTGLGLAGLGASPATSSLNYGFDDRLSSVQDTASLQGHSETATLNGGGAAGGAFASPAMGASQMLISSIVQRLVNRVSSSVAKCAAVR